MAKKDKKQTPTSAEQPEPATAAVVDPAENNEPAQNGADTEPESYVLSAAEFKQVQEHIAALTKARDEAVSLLQRNQADFDNYRKRNVSARAESYEEGRRAVVKELLPFVDNFDRAMEADSSAAGAWQEGVKLVHRQFMEILAKQGLAEIEADGAFDPNFHNAVLSEKAEGKKNGEILQVLQKGYRMGETIIRHSMVKVAE